MRSKRELPDREVHIWRASLSDWLEYSEQFHLWLASDERERLARYKIAAKQKDFLISRGLLRFVLAAYLESTPESITLSATPDGKPYIRDSLMKFSLSHTNDQWIASITAADDCGVDIEANLPTRNLDRIVRKSFHPAERDYLNGLDSRSELDREFLSVWTAKEAYLKARGLGIKEYPNWFSLLPDKDQKDRFLLNDPRLSNNNQNWTILRLKELEDCQGAVAANTMGFVVKTKVLTPADLIDKAVSSAYPEAAGSEPD